MTPRGRVGLVSCWSWAVHKINIEVNYRFTSNMLCSLCEKCDLTVRKSTGSLRAVHDQLKEVPILLHGALQNVYSAITHKNVSNLWQVPYIWIQEEVLYLPCQLWHLSWDLPYNICDSCKDSFANPYFLISYSYYSILCNCTFPDCPIVCLLSNHLFYTIHKLDVM